MTNKKLIPASILFIAIIVSGIFALMRFERPYANAAPVSSLPDIKIVVDDSTTNVSTPSLKPSGIAIEILNMWRGKIIGKEGWLHLVYQIDSEVGNGIVLPDGSLMSSSQIEDGWYYINENGLVEKDVVTIKDLNGNILQQSAFNGKTGINFTFGFRDDRLVPYEIKLDRGFLQILLETESLGIPIYYQDIQHKDKPGKEFSFAEIYYEPVQFGIEQEFVESAHFLVCFPSRQAK